MATQLGNETTFGLPIALTDGELQSEDNDQQDCTATLPPSFIPRLKSRDQEAFADLYQTYRRRVFSSILKIVESRTAAEDLAQESFLRLWRSAPDLKVEFQDVVPWLMTIARNCARDYRRSASNCRIQQIVSDHPAPIGSEHERLFCDRNQIHLAFQQLSPEQKEVIILSFYKGLSQAAIAEYLKQPLGTVKGRVRSALAKLRTALDADAGRPDISSVRYH